MSGAGFARIAQTFNCTDTGLMIAFLEGHGVGVLVPHFHMHNTWPMAGAALGGIPICVPVDQADEARALLATITPLNPTAPKQTIWRVLMWLVMWKTGTAPTLRGVFLNT